MLTSHEELTLTSCGFYVSVEHPFLGASPDALIEYKYCGLRVVEIKCPLCAQESSLMDAANENWNFSLDECCDGKYQLKCTMNTTTNVNSILLLLVVAFVIL